MASAQDILSALGPDAQGLPLTPEKLPDLFELTASRLDEQPKKFVVETPYLSGRWKGGKAVIEYARDLSYTLVSVYDKDGRRQRIYSVRARSKPRDNTQFQTLVKSIDVGAPPPRTSAEVDVDESGAVPQPSASHSRSSGKKRRHGRSAEPAPPPSDTGSPDSGSVADLMPVGQSEVAVPSASGGQSKTSSSKDTGWVPSGMASKPKKETEVVDLAAAEPGTGYEWNEKLGAYVPVKSSGGAAERYQTAGSAGKSKKRRHGKSSEPPAEAAAPSTSATSGGNATGGVSDNVPSTEELLAGPDAGSPAQPAAAEKSSNASANSSSDQGAGSSRSSSSKGSSRWWHKKHASSSDTNTTAVAAAPTASSAQSGSSAQTGAPADTTMTPTELAALTKKMRAREQAQQSSDADYDAASGGSNSSEAAPPPERESTPVTTMTPSERAARDAARRRSSSYASPASGGSASASASAGPAYDAALDSNQKGHGALDSDKWSPKARAAAPAEDEQPTQVAMAVRPPPDTSVANLMKEAAQEQSAMPDDSAKWQPKNTPKPQADADVIAELNRIRAAQKPPPQPVKIRRDINNPEEGVLPVNSFEKFSGPRYGRHREYERRFYYGKRPKAPIANYDFYVDEVDRKKEIHNIYYYQKGKAPKLVAIERHSHVTFLTNYDVDTEDKGKVNKY